MGRWPWSERLLVEDCYWVSVWVLERAGVFDAPVGTCFPFFSADRLLTGQVRCHDPSRAYIELKLMTEEGRVDTRLRTYSIGVTRTPCHFGIGSRRHWFFCPVCRKRIGKLYVPTSETSLGCRHCVNLTYASRSRRRLKRS